MARLVPAFSIFLFRFSSGHYQGRERRRLGLLLVAFALLVPGWLGAKNDGKPPATLEGKLLLTPGVGPALREHGKDQPLSAITPYLLHTLEDKRLANREVRVEGIPKTDGTFEVARLYTLRNGKLYRVRYFCNICNIEALEPGNCVCCQQPTELQEIPVTEDH
jgi:hypothetical protein